MGDLSQSRLGSVYTTAMQGDRSQQQDAYRARWLDFDGAWLIVIADGMGGHAAGDLAGKLAVDCFVAAFASLREGNSDFEAAFVGALKDANSLIASVQASRPETAGMGTTLVAAHISGEGLRWISVGDSPLCIYRDGSIMRLNEDHSLREVDPSDRGGASANMLRSALTGGPIQLIDLHIDPIKVLKSDLVILSSDGVLTISGQEMAKVIQASPAHRPDIVGERLIEAVTDADNPRQDNCTIAVYSRGGSPVRDRITWLAASKWGLGIIAGSIALAVLLTAYLSF
jgi:serine/threonine protein phosphatase PrpC